MDTFLNFGKGYNEKGNWNSIMIKCIIINLEV